MEITDGSPSPLGLSFLENHLNFALLSHHAAHVFLGIFLPGKNSPEKEIPMKRSGNVWHVAIDKAPKEALYAYRLKIEEEPSLYLPIHEENWLDDPYSKCPDTREKWSNGQEKKPLRSFCTPIPSFDWEGIQPPKIPLQDLIIYEMHVRGFTQDSSSSVANPGTFAGVIEKIPYLKKLGINAVELMPVFEFDETHSKAHNPDTKELLPNYWGYSPLYFFSPMRRYAADAKGTGPILEFKKMVKELHKNQIEVILDVVYNHTGEDSHNFIHFRGIDKPVYYMLDKAGNCKNYTGCGNTLNTNHPAVIHLILDSLRYWILEMGVDGFRFDLASIFNRNNEGSVLDPSPILQAIADDPIIRNVKLIAEPWDAAGLYQVGKFPHWGPWSEWNGQYRDIVRRFIKGTDGKVGLFASVISGSELIYGYTKTPISSVNFITAHDGFTLKDLVTYQQKQNRANGEENRDGSNQNDNWNCGCEGKTTDPKIIHLREKQIRNFLLTLFISQGVPMLLMGDEYGHSRHGNNNAYVQDNQLNWFLWDELKKNQKFFDYTRGLIQFRKAHAALRSLRFFSSNDIEWHGKEPLQPNWNGDSRFVAFTLKEPPQIYVAFNASYHHVSITLPPNIVWKEIINTDKNWEHFLDHEEKAPDLPSQLELPPRTCLLAKEKR